MEEAVWNLPPTLDYAENDPLKLVEEIVRWENAGLDAVWVAEAWGFDSPTIMGYLAARTERLKSARTSSTSTRARLR